ncbi:heat-inducible transcriptional repressor HrcA [Pacificimonas sp. WHA3]|uniref:Heat-inducible transcription repressor HrcA n=1 Tax=Pacificimonas pallii TaxID=2827236 RepID=A0ABS6SC33_9SPHN|nr:heat-inducible transcriptional repressor HrcA [Pacificimonas pallii]MBV7255422.1 heat-inducible transcriptional repressor HrcA [Pacificimonas pallii]
MPSLADLSERARTVFQQVVDEYLDSGVPVGSKYLAQLPGGLGLSPASIRSVLAELEAAGLLASPHTSAGRMPTDSGLRLFVDGMIEWSAPDAEERAAIEAQVRDVDTASAVAMERMTGALSGLASCAALVMVPTGEMTVKEVAFSMLSDTRALAILIGSDGTVENRVIEAAAPLDTARLTEAANYMNAHLSGLSLSDAVARLKTEVEGGNSALDSAARDVISRGLASWSTDERGRAVLIVRGQAHLIDDVAAIDLERVRQLLEDIDEKEQLLGVLDMARQARAMKIFIGSENKLYSLSGSSLIASPYQSGDGKLLGVVGVIGPTRLNYARIIPMVDYTAKTLSRLMR